MSDVHFAFMIKINKAYTTFVCTLFFVFIHINCHFIALFHFIFCNFFQNSNCLITHSCLLFIDMYMYMHVFIYIYIYFQSSKKSIFVKIIILFIQNLISKYIHIMSVSETFLRAGRPSYYSDDLISTLSIKYCQ